MDTATNYRVVFAGHIRKGFKPEQVRNTLTQRLKLSEAQAEKLFGGEDSHTIKRTQSEEEAKRFAMQLAKLGAVARVEPVAVETRGQPEKAASKANEKEKAEKPPKLSKYKPFPSSVAFVPLLYTAVGFEALLAIGYGLLLAGLLFGTLYFSLFTAWGATLLGSPLLGLLVQVLCLPLGLLLLFIFAKPLLGLQNTQHRGIALPADQEPQLHQFVAGLSEKLQLPTPVEIRLNNAPSVEMYHHRGPIGFWRSETVLTIGMPLTAVINSSQLAAQITQAMVCFRHHKAPRASFLLMGLIRMLQRSAYDEDLLDRGVRQWQQQGRLSPGVASAVLKLFAFSHKILKLRLTVSRSLHRRLLHRLVADADRYALAMAGSDGFAKMQKQKRLLARAIEEMQGELFEMWQVKGELPEDWIPLLTQRVRSYPATIHREVMEQHEQEKARTGDIIPSDSQRIKKLGKQQVQPAYSDLSPAHSQLRYFPKLALAMTLRFYHNRMQLPITPDKLIHYVPKGSKEYEVNQTVNAFFKGLWHPLIPLKLGLALHGKSSKEEATKQWSSAVKVLKHSAGRIVTLYKESQETDERLLDSTIKEALYRAELWRQMGESKLSSAELEDFYQFCRDNEQVSEAALVKLRQATRPFAERLTAAIAMLRLSPLSSEDKDTYQEAQSLINTYDRIEGVFPTIREIKLNTALLKVLLSYRRGHGQSKLDDRINEVSADIERELTSIRVALMSVNTPFAVGKHSKNLMEYLLEDAYTEETPDGEFDRGNDVVKRLDYIQRQLLARLIIIAGKAEKQLLV